MSEAIELVAKLVEVYPNGGSNAGRGYIGALAAVLADYPRQIATQCCDRTKGIVRNCKFLPTIADIVAWCEPELAKMRAPVNHYDRNTILEACVKADRADDDYWQKARAGRPTIEEMKAHYGEKWGIAQPPRKEKPYKSLTDDELRALYGPQNP